jgi:hypothetical protein
MSTKRSTILYLSVIWLFAVTIRIILFTGYMNGDMGNYIQEAHNFFEGHYSVEEIIKNKSIKDLIPNPNFNWQNLRLGLIIPAGLLMRLFGVSDFSFAMLMFGCFTLGYIMVYLLGKELISESFGILSALLFSFIPLEINLSTMLVPHIPAASFMAVSCFFLLKAPRVEERMGRLFIFLSGVSLSIAYLVWEVSLLLMPVILMYLAVVGGFPKAFFKKEFLTSCLFFASGFMPLYIAELIYFYNISGVLFFQQKFISVLGPKWLELHPSDLANLKWNIYLKSMFHSFFFGIFYYFVFGGLLTILFQYFFDHPGRKKLLSSMLLPVIWFLWLGVYLQFGTSSISHYQPIFKMSHYLSILSIPASLLGAYFVYSFPYVGLLKNVKSKELWASNIKTGLVSVFLVSSLLCASNNFMGNGPFHRDMTFEHRIKETVDALPPGGPLYTDIWTKHGLDFVYGYKRPVVAFNSIGNEDYRPAELADMKSGYVIINRIYLSSGHTMNTYVPEFVNDPPRGWKLQARISGTSRSKSIDIYSVSQ